MTGPTLVALFLRVESNGPQIESFHKLIIYRFCSADLARRRTVGPTMPWEQSGDHCARAVEGLPSNFLGVDYPFQTLSVATLNNGMYAGSWYWFWDSGYDERMLKRVSGVGVGRREALGSQSETKGG